MENNIPDRTKEISKKTYQLPIDCITKIIIGPSLDQENTNQTLTKLLWDKGFDLDLVKIEKSTIPYRE